MTGHHQHGDSNSIQWKNYWVWLTSLCIFIMLAMFDWSQAASSASFVVGSSFEISPYLLVSIFIAAWVEATGSDHLIAKAFSGAPFFTILLAAFVGGVSPFCSCGVIPLIAALLAMGVPLSAVMAFWLASPIMDPSMFFLMSGILGIELAVAKTIAAISIGCIGGLIVYSMESRGAFANPLREAVGCGGCSAKKVTDPKPVKWGFWKEPEGRSVFLRSALHTSLFLAKWLVFAFLLESLMLAFVPAEAIVATVGGEGVTPIVLATFVGIPAHLNGYAALPLVDGFIEHGMTPGAALAFLIAGGVTSIPCAMAVWALARAQVFALYLFVSLLGAMGAGFLFQTWLLLG